MKRLVEKGMGIGVIPREYAEAELADGRLQLIETDFSPSARSVGMVLPKNVTTSYALRMFIEQFGIKI